MAGRPKSQRVEVLVERIDAVHLNPTTPEAEQLIREALSSKHWMAVEHAAHVIAQHSLAQYAQELLAVWQHFVGAGIKADPGCRAKESALLALDTLEWFDPDPFLAAVRHVQLEPGYGGATDTAGGVRQRGLFGLLRQHHSQALLYAGELLADPLVDVRVGAADALYQYAGRTGTGLLTQRLHLGDDPRVLLACATGLIEHEPDYALVLCERWLKGADAERRETAALALGQSKSDEAGDVLIQWSRSAEHGLDRELMLRALSLHRGARARGYVLELVASDNPVEARAAVKALAEHRYDAQLCQRVQEAAATNPDPAIRKLAQTLCSPR